MPIFYVIHNCLKRAIALSGVTIDAMSCTRAYSFNNLRRRNEIHIRNP
jgi:hypothetical protein